MPTFMEEIHQHVRTLTRFVYVVTEEEDVFLVELNRLLQNEKSRIQVFNPTLGLIPINTYLEDWKCRAHQPDMQTVDVNQALVKIFQEDPQDATNFYVILDPDRYLTRDPHVIRRFLNLAHQSHQDIRAVKMYFLVSNRPTIPDKLSRYVTVVRDKGMTDPQIEQHVEQICSHLKREPPAGMVKHFRGLSRFQIGAAIAESIIKTKQDPKAPKRIDPKLIAEFKFIEFIKLVAEFK